MSPFPGEKTVSRRICAGDSKGDNLRPAPVIDLARLWCPEPSLIQSRLDDHRRHTGTAAGDDGLVGIDTLVLKQLLQLLLGQEGLGLGVEHLVEGDVDGAGHVARGQTGSRIWVHAGPPALASRVDDLHALCTLLVVVQRDLAHILEACDFVRVHLWDRVGVALDVVQLATLGGQALVHPQPEVVEQVDLWVPKDLERPADARGAENAQLFCIVDDNGVLAAEAQLAHGGGKGLRAGQHVGVLRVLVDDLIEVEEAGLGDALLAEDLDAGAALGVVWHEPRGTEGDDAGVGADRGGGVLLEGFVELLGGDEIGGEGAAGAACHKEGRGGSVGSEMGSRRCGPCGTGWPEDGYGGHLEVARALRRAGSKSALGPL